MADEQRAEEAPVGKYPERPYEEARMDPDEIVKVEDRQPDQIADYHDTHPTLHRTKVEAKAIEQVQEQMADPFPGD